MLSAEKLDALAAVRSSKLSSERTKAMDYYNGDMTADMPAQEGRSRAVSSDVSDTIEGLMPSLMDIFAGSDEVVRFEPTGPQDVQAAEQETDYVNHVFMQQNPGFLILYSFIKDALLSKVGIVKVFWEEHEEEQRETYLDQDDDAFMMLVADPEIRIVAHTMHPAPAQMSIAPVPGMPGLPQLAPPTGVEGPAPAQEPGGVGAGAPVPSPVGAPPAPATGQELQPAPQQPMLHDITVVTTKKTAKAVVVGVPPEEFGISRHARSLRDCGYCFHEVIRRQEDLISDGYDADQVKAIPTYTMLTNPEELARDSVDEHLSGGGDEGINEVNRQIKVTEHYVRMDYEGNGKVELYRVTTGGDQGDVLRRDGDDEIVQVDMIPFAAMTPVIVTHRFFGRSIADLVMDIQRIKTALLRGILDNAYLAVNPRCVVAEPLSTETTLDDLLVSRPGGIVRAKSTDAVEWQTIPSIAAEIFPVLEYADQTREWRSGVNRQQQGVDANALQNQSATAVLQVYNASQAKMKLIARIFAETGIRDLFSLLHGVIRKNGSKAATVRLRNQWVEVDPRDWIERNDMTILVGLGAGGKAEQGQQLMAIGNIQKEIAGAGLANVVKPENVYKLAVEVCKTFGRKDYTDFFSDPSDPNNPAPPPKPDPKMVEIQAQAQIDAQEAQVRQQMERDKLQGDMQLQQQRFQDDRTLELIKAHQAGEKHQQDMTQSAQKHAHDMAKAEADQMQKAITAATASGDGKEGSGGGANVAPLVGHLMTMMKQINAPKRVVRDAQGRVSHVEPMPH